MKSIWISMSNYLEVMDRNEKCTLRCIVMYSTSNFAFFLQFIHSRSIVSVILIDIQHQKLKQKVFLFVAKFSCKIVADFSEYGLLLDNKSYFSKLVLIFQNLKFKILIFWIRADRLKWWWSYFPSTHLKFNDFEVISFNVTSSIFHGI